MFELFESDVYYGRGENIGRMEELVFTRFVQDRNINISGIFFVS